MFHITIIPYNLWVKPHNDSSVSDRISGSFFDFIEYVCVMLDFSIFVLAISKRTKTGLFELLDREVSD